MQSLFWWPLRHALILPLRAPRSARLYRRVWMDDGSPLAVFSARLHYALELELEAQRPGAVAIYATNAGARHLRQPRSDPGSGSAQAEADVVVVAVHLGVSASRSPT